MKLNQVIGVVVVLAIIGFIFYSMQGGQSDEAYAAEIKKERDEKDFQMTLEDSPFGEDRKNFTKLNYFEPDLKYRISASLEPIENKNMVVLSTNDGKETRYLEYAHATFTLDGVKNRLLILEIVEPGSFKGTLFLAFADKTSANETYGAGRYLDVKKVPGSSSILLDFNKAYNPYCAYSEHYSCPFPPRENILNVAIRAGEKTYH